MLPIGRHRNNAPATILAAFLLVLRVVDAQYVDALLGQREVDAKDAVGEGTGHVRPWRKPNVQSVSVDILDCCCGGNCSLRACEQPQSTLGRP